MLQPLGALCACQIILKVMDKKVDEKANKVANEVIKDVTKEGIKASDELEGSEAGWVKSLVSLNLKNAGSLRFYYLIYIMWIPKNECTNIYLHVIATVM